MQFLDALVAWITKVNDLVNGVVWGPPMLLLLVGVGVYFTFRTGFFQVRKFGFLLKTTILSVFRDKSTVKSNDKNAISQFQALATTLAATIGTGNIVGVATAIGTGGPGAVFWMWVSAFFGMMTSFAENVLGIYYRKKNEKGEWIGGSMMFLEHGLGCKWLAVLFAVFSLIASFGIGNIAQVNGISVALETTFRIPPVVTGIVLAIFIAFVLLGGLKRVAVVTEKLVPGMALLYTVGAIAVIAMNWKQIPSAFGEIFRGAFDLQSVGGGVMGYTIARAMRYGVSRGVFSNEAGLGSSVMVNSCSDVKEPAVQGMWGAFAVFFDTLVMCTLTALIVITSGAHLQGLEGVEITNFAFTSSIGPAGGMVLSICILLFAFSTVLGWSVYGSKAVEYLFGNHAVSIYKLCFAAVVFIGAISSVQLVWDLSDTFNGLMALPNLVGLIFLSGTVMKVANNYFDRTFRGAKVPPMLSVYDEPNSSCANRR